MNKQVKIFYKPNSDHQKRFHASKAYERLLMTGFGGGKTMAGAAEHLKLCLLNPGFDSLIVVQNIPVARKTVIPVFKRLLEQSNVKYKYNAASFIFTLIDFNHTVYISSADMPDSLKGSNVTHVWFDELASMSKEAYVQGIARCRQKCYTGNRLFHTTTPEGLNWVYEEFFMTERDNREIITGASSDNPSLSETYIKSLKDRYTPEEQEMYIHGRFAKSRSGLIIPEWNDNFLIDNYPDPHYALYDHYVAIDLGVVDKTAILFGTYYFPRAKLIIEDEVIFQGNHMTSLAIADAIRSTEERLWGEPSRQPFRVSDWNNPLLLQDLSMLHGIYVVNAQKDTVEAMVNQARVFIGAGRLGIKRHCSETLGNLNLGKWNDKKIKPDFQRSVSYGHLDALAALLIMIRNIDQQSNPIPEAHYDPFSSIRIINPNKNKYQALEDIFNG